MGTQVGAVMARLSDQILQCRHLGITRSRSALRIARPESLGLDVSQVEKVGQHERGLAKVALGLSKGCYSDGDFGVDASHIGVIDDPSLMKGLGSLSQTLQGPERRIGVTRPHLGLFNIHERRIEIVATRSNGVLILSLEHAPGCAPPGIRSNAWGQARAAGSPRSGFHSPLHR